MNFADFVCREAIMADLKAEDKEGVIREMTHALLDAGEIAKTHYDSIVTAIVKREALGTTGISPGVAIPHAKHPSVDRPIGAAAVSRQGVDFASIDGELVHFFFLLISPSDHPDQHFRALEKIARPLRDDAFRRFLTQAKSIEEIKELLDESDNNHIDKCAGVPQENHVSSGLDATIQASWKGPIQSMSISGAPNGDH